MLNRSSRLTTKQFNEAMKNGKVVHSTFFIARIQSPTPSFRAAAVAPVKIAKTAVVRNRSRRRIYAAVRSLSLPASAKAHVILIAKSPLLIDDGSDAMRADLRSLFVKAGLLR